jgi:hypothetical protein
MTINLRVGLVLGPLIPEDKGTTILRGNTRPATKRHSLLGLWVRILAGAWMSVLVSVVCCQVEVSATGWSLVHRSPTDCGVSKVCDREASKNETA